MAATRGPLLNPIKEEQESYPYRHVWGSAIIQIVVLAAATAVIFVANSLLGIRLPPAIAPAFNTVLVLLPVGVWILLSVLPERRVSQPRDRLVFVVIVTALVASGVALPLLDGFLQPELWLPHESAINRILGYTFTLGIIQEVSKYIVLRYAVWRDHFRIRTDAVAYAFAAAVGFATVQSINVVLANPSMSLDVVALRMFEHLAINIAASLFVSLGLAETRFDHPTPFFMTISVALAALFAGIAQPIISGLENATFSSQGSFARPLFGFAFALAVAAVALVVNIFLFSSAERRERERLRAEDAR
ncbi:MAG: PrsW family intramembrane metalloprotease [Chloroflexi bacterium]|nr:PrsW family intramembrane metalloprotease [Chloroflexota bacterium]